MRAGWRGFVTVGAFAREILTRAKATRPLGERKARGCCACGRKTACSLVCSLMYDGKGDCIEACWELFCWAGISAPFSDYAAGRRRRPRRMAREGTVRSGAACLSAVCWGTARSSTVRWRTARHRVARWGAACSSTARLRAVRSGAARSCAARWRAVRSGAARSSAARLRAARYGCIASAFEIKSRHDRWCVAAVRTKEMILR